MIVDVISLDEFMSFVDCHFIINMMLNLVHNQAIMFQLFELELNLVSWLVGWSPGREHGVVFVGKTLYSHSAFLNSGV